MFAFTNPRLGAHFKVYHLTTSLAPARLALTTAALLYGAFAIIDLELPWSQTWRIWCIRGVVVSLTLAALLASYRRPSFNQLQAWLVAVALASSTGFIVMIALAPPPSRNLYFSGLLLGVVYISVLFQLQYSYALSVSLIVFLLYLVSCVVIEGTPSLSMYNNIAIYLAFFIAGISSSHAIEYYKRRDFMRTRAIRRRASALHAILASVERIRRRAEDASRRDPLTGLFNRRHFVDTATALLASSAPAQVQSFAVMMIDVDWFKRVNDTYGHAAGDAVLCGIADRLRSFEPRGALVSRFGGEEIAMLLPTSCATTAVSIACDLNALIRTSPFLLPDGPAIYLTVSIGIVVRTTHDLSTIDDMLCRADRALYVAKYDGRDRAILWSTTLSSIDRRRPTAASR